MLLVDRMDNEKYIEELKDGSIPLFEDTPLKIIFKRLINEFSSVGIHGSRGIEIYGKSELDPDICSKVYHGEMIDNYCILRMAFIPEEEWQK